MSGPLDELRSAIKQRQALVLVGAGCRSGRRGGQPAVEVEGLEKPVPVASWLGLLYHGVAYCEEWVKPRPGSGKIVRGKIGLGDLGDLELLLSAATKIENQLGAPKGGNYRRGLRESVGSLADLYSRVGN
jgi:hypothetical protein